MPTGKGLVVASTGVALFATGILFGARSLEQLGIGLVAVMAIAIVIVRVGRHDLDITRTLTPERVPAGHPVTLGIDIVNHGTGPAPLVLLEDRLPAQVRGSARFAISGVEAHGRRHTRVELRAPRRGRYRIGPLELSLVDPFRLARVGATAAGATSFLVHPAIDPLSPVRDVGERRHVAAAALKQFTGTAGEDFYTLREYVEGDDLRKIHWPSTAKRDRYMIRQEETPWQSRATVVLDDRSEAHEGVGSASSFERAVEAAASLIELYHRIGYSFRLVAAHNRGVLPGKGREHTDRCLDLLATIDSQPSAQPDVDPLIYRLAELEASPSGDAALVIVTGTLSSRDAMAITRCARQFRNVTVVSYPRHRFGSGTTKSRWQAEGEVVETVRVLTRASVRTVMLGPDESLSAAWSATRGRGPHREREWVRRPELV